MCKDDPHKRCQKLAEYFPAICMILRDKDYVGQEMNGQESI